MAKYAIGQTVRFTGVLGLAFEAPLEGVIRVVQESENFGVLYCIWAALPGQDATLWQAVPERFILP